MRSFMLDEWKEYIRRTTSTGKSKQACLCCLCNQASFFSLNRTQSFRVYIHRQVVCEVYIHRGMHLMSVDLLCSIPFFQLQLSRNKSWKRRFLSSLSFPSLSNSLRGQQCLLALHLDRSRSRASLCTPNCRSLRDNTDWGLRRKERMKILLLLSAL